MSKWTCLKHAPRLSHIPEGLFIPWLDFKGKGIEVNKKLHVEYKSSIGKAKKHNIWPG